MRKLSESAALARLQREKAAYQSHVVKRYEGAAQDCRNCPTAGECCTDAHFVNVHITRLEAAAIRETLARTPRLDDSERRAVYERARKAVERYNLSASGDTFAQTFSCPLFEPKTGCLVHRRAKPAPCIQHACYERWEDMPPAELEWRAERRIERLNEEAYGAAWAWLPLPVWLTLVDPAADGRELSRLSREWLARSEGRAPKPSASNPRRRHLPVFRA